MRSIVALVGMALLYTILTLVLLITTRMFAEARFIPSSGMQPAVSINDRVLIEKISDYLKKPYVRGEIVVFYPPPSEMGGKDLSWDLGHILGRLTGLPFLPYEPAFIKRVIGLPGERIRIVSGQGVFVNGELLDETSYIPEAANYNLDVLSDTCERSVTGGLTKPYGAQSKPIIVMPGQLFILGDNRNNSEDSHVFGMLDQKRVIGRLQLRYYPSVEIIEPPKYPPAGRGIRH